MESMTSAVALVVVILLIILMKKSKAAVAVDLPPGPKKLPIIGNLHLISQPPFRCLRDLARRYGPIMHVKLGEVDTVVVSSPQVAKEIMKDNDPVFTNRPESIALKIFWYNYTDVAFSPYGGYWRQMRKITTEELLSSKNVRSFASIREDEVSRLVESLRLSAGNPINLTEKVFSTASSVTCRAAFGMACKDKEYSLIKLVKEGLRMSSGISVADCFPSSRIVNALSWGTKLRLMRMRRRLDLILDDIIHKHEDSSRRGNGDEDLVDVLLRIKNQGDLEFPIGYDNIKAVLFGMFAGGTETSSSTVEWTMTELMRNPRVMAKAQAEVRQVAASNSPSLKEEDIPKLSYLKLVIMETLRLHPQGAIIARVSREQRQIGGYTIPEKLRVIINVWAIQRDPKYWEHPETFEPERFLNQPSLDFTGSDFRYLPFGSGKRVCPGIAFGWASVVLPLAHLLYNFNWKLPNGVQPHDLNMNENMGVTSSRKENLYVVATPYQPSSAMLKS